MKKKGIELETGSVSNCQIQEQWESSSVNFMHEGFLSGNRTILYLNHSDSFINIYIDKTMKKQEHARISV